MSIERARGPKEKVKGQVLGGVEVGRGGKGSGSVALKTAPVWKGNQDYLLVVLPMYIAEDRFMQSIDKSYIEYR